MNHELHIKAGEPVRLPPQEEPIRGLGIDAGIIDPDPCGLLPVPNLPTWTSKYPAITSFHYRQNAHMSQTPGVAAVTWYAGNLGIELIAEDGTGLSCTGASLERLRETLGGGRPPGITLQSSPEIRRADIYGEALPPFKTPETDEEAANLMKDALGASDGLGQVCTITRTNGTLEVRITSLDVAGFSRQMRLIAGIGALLREQGIQAPTKIEALTAPPAAEPRLDECTACFDKRLSPADASGSLQPDEKDTNSNA